MPGTRIGEYRVETQLGGGAMGVVYGAVHPLIGKRAAIKVMRAAMARSAEATGRFIQEARAVAQIGHPNIVDAFSFGVLPDGRCYFVMEWLSGEPLAERLQRGHVPLDTALDVLVGIAHGLEAAHAVGVVHRDLKPDNVFLVATGGRRPLVKILDFSVAKLTDLEPARPALTRVGMVVGTPAYMSPEQAAGRRADFRSDVYSFGVLAFEVLVGRLPFWSEDRAVLAKLHLEQPPPAPADLRPGLPVALDVALRGMLAKDPAARPTLVEVREAFEHLAAARRAADGQETAPIPRVGAPPAAPAPAGVVTVLEPDAAPDPGCSSGEVGVIGVPPPATAPPRRRWVVAAGLVVGAVMGFLTVVALTGVMRAGGSAAAAPEPAARSPVLRQARVEPVVVPLPLPPPTAAEVVASAPVRMPASAEREERTRAPHRKRPRKAPPSAGERIVEVQRAPPVSLTRGRDDGTTLP